MKTEEMTPENQIPWEDHPSFRAHGEAIDEMTRAYHMKSRWELEFMRTIQKAEELGTHREMGYDQISDFVTSYFGLGHFRACEFTDVALSMKSLPKITSAFEGGSLSYDHLRALTRVATKENEDDLLRATVGRSVSDTFKIVEKMIPVTKEDSVEARKNRRLETAWDKQSHQLLYWGQLPEEMGVIFEKTIDAIARSLPPDPLFEGDPTPLTVKRADALFKLVTENSGSETESPPAQVIVHIDSDTLLTGQGMGELEGGPTIGIETVNRLLCDSQVRAIVENSDGKPIGYGRAYRTVPPKMKQDLIYRDRTCRWTGCRNYKLVEAHHIDEYGRDQGNTDYDNMILFCKYHHTMVHEGGYRIVGTPPDIVILPPEEKNLPPLRNGPPPLTDRVREEFEREFRESRAPDDP